MSVAVAPVDALLNCIGRKTVDFWSLDVEGVEQYILAHTPFDDIEVGVMLIEMNKSEENSKGIVDVMTKYGFKEVGTTDFDRIYVNPTYFLNRGLSVPESDLSLVQVKKDLVRSSVGSYKSMTNIHVVDDPQVPPWGYAIEIPTGITHVSINIGPSTTPIKVDGDGNLLILVDPLPSVAAYLRQHFGGPHVLVYEAAISNFSGTAVFHEYNEDGLSSSLSTPSESASWNQNSSSITVQVHTLKELLDAIPSNLAISFLKTDMQGYDFTAIKSAGNELKRVKRIMSETFQDGKPTYANTLNEYNRDWLPYMTGMGYTMDSEQIPKGKPTELGYTGCTDSFVAEPAYHEMDCHWILSDSVD